MNATIQPHADEPPGIYHARTDNGEVLPVIDVTHPAFHIDMSPDELEQQLQDHLRTVEERDKAPAFVQNIFLWFMMRRSRLMRAINGAAGGFLVGMETYILKLGPANMHKPFASSIDARISASLPGLSVRLRLQNVAQMLAGALVSPLTSAPGRALHLVNIGGGPAIDSLNALIILHRQPGNLLAGRQIAVHVLDLDDAGPHFGERALAALHAGGAPLHGLPITMEWLRYDWSDATPVRELLNSIGGDCIMAASSEGALFEYGTDEVITSNLKALKEGTPPEAIVVGSVTRADTTGRLLNGGSRAALQMRGIDGFRALAEAAGWYIAEQRDRPSGHDVCLKKRA